MVRGLKCLALCLCVVGTIAAVGHADLIGHWKLDEGSGEVAADASGNGHDGTLMGGVTWADGYFDGALEFAGGGQKVDIPHSQQLNPEDEFTVSLWANVDATGTGHRSPVTSRDDFPQRGYIIYVEPGNTWQFWTGTGAAWNNTPGPAAVAGEWTHVTATYANEQKGFYINGEQVGQSTASFSPNTQQVLRIGGGATEGDGNYFFVGLIDDVRVYDHALSEGQMAAVMAGEPYPFAAAPTPGVGTMIESTQVTLEWSPGELATTHHVFVGEDAEAVAAATVDDAETFLGATTETQMSIGTAGGAYPDGLTPGQTYYWRVDAVDETNPESPWKGEVWSFWVQPVTAWDPEPTDAAIYVDPNQDLSWAGGQGVLFHTVYFGESREEVESATTDGWMTGEPTYDPGPLKPDTTYYWRVDEFSQTGTHKGSVWSLTTLPEIAVTDPDLLAWWKLDEGVGRTVVDWSGYGHHGELAGDPQWVGGYAGGGLAFDGSGDYVDFGTPADLYQPENYTYCAWFKVGRNVFGNSGAQYLLCIGSRSDLVLGVEDSVGENGDLSLHYYDTSPGFSALGVGQVVWSSEQWHMVAATKEAGVGHKIYLDGELMNSDSNTNNDNYATTRMISLGARGWTNPNVAFFNGTLDEVRIYNRALTEQEIQDLLVTDPLLAGDPVPSRDAVVDIREADSLQWSAGSGADSHDVYLGTDRATVVAADRDSSAFLGNQPGTSLSLDGLVVFDGGDYYWRIDEVEAGGTVDEGDVWKFTVPSYLIVDDFESYTHDMDADEAIFQTWIDGVENGTGSFIGYENSTGGTFGETVVVYEGGQAAPLQYDNASSPYYSEVFRTWPTSQDWTAGGADTLVVYVQGQSDNAPVPLYVAIEDTAGNLAVVDYGDESVVTSTQWVEWPIALDRFSGVDASSIKTMYIGLGDRDNATPGGTGLIYVDGIRVIKADTTE